MKENVAWGESEILTTPKGMIVRSLMEANIKLGVSSRGAGTVKNSIVQTNFNFIAQDIVFSPSAPTAFVENIMEGFKLTEWCLENNVLVEKEVDFLLNGLKNLRNRPLEEKILETFDSFMNFAMNKTYK